jgi:DNA-directed RNA polymerase alpha subunit
MKKKKVFVSCRQSIKESPTNFYGRFYIGSFDSGQSITLANCLRRTLLSELHGLSITSVEIEGASHEYSTLIGVREPVLDVLLNLKQIVLKSKINITQPQLGFLQVKGPWRVTAADLRLPNFIQSVDPTQYIATLNYEGFLSLKLKIRQGKNYVTHQSFDPKPHQAAQDTLVYSGAVLKNKQPDFSTIHLNAEKKPEDFLIHHDFSTSQKKEQTLQTIKKNKPFHHNTYFTSDLDFSLKTPSFAFDNKNYGDQLKKRFLGVDSVFMPIHKVNYTIEIDSNYSLNSKEFIVLEIWTNGSITPQEALNQATERLVHMFIDFKKAKMLV